MSNKNKQGIIKRWRVHYSIDTANEEIDVFCDTLDVALIFTNELLSDGNGTVTITRVSHHI